MLLLLFLTLSLSLCDVVNANTPLLFIGGLLGTDLWLDVDFAVAQLGAPCPSSGHASLRLSPGACGAPGVPSECVALAAHADRAGVTWRTPPIGTPLADMVCFSFFF